MSEADDKGAIEQALEVLVYAPLGFALEARSLVPRFIDRGRNQIILARVVGKYAVRKGTTAAESAVEQVQGTASGVLRLVGVLPADEPSSNGHRVQATVDRADDGDEDGATEPEPPAPPPVDPATLAIPDYDSLSASQVVPRLESLDPDELEAVREYEAATRGRKTILSKIAQIQAG